MLKLTPEERLSVVYHDIFDYPLTLDELIKWKVSREISSSFNKNKLDLKIDKKGKYYFLYGREGLSYKRMRNERTSKAKLEIAKKAARILSFLPTVKFVGITGALAMNNAGEDSDIDFFVVTKSNKLWTTRFLVFVLFFLFGVKIRKPKSKEEKNKLCLNMWLDESDLSWGIKNRNIYTAHEIAQIIPLVNKKNTWEKFLFKNKWILNYWPNSIRVVKVKIPIEKKENNFSLFENIAYKFQYTYMKKKITRETITRTKAIFHPNDWSNVVLRKLTT